MVPPLAKTLFVLSTLLWTVYSSKTNEIFYIKLAWIFLTVREAFLYRVKIFPFELIPYQLIRQKHKICNSYSNLSMVKDLWFWLHYNWDFSGNGNFTTKACITAAWIRFCISLFAIMCQKTVELQLLTNWYCHFPEICSSRWFLAYL